MKSTVTSTTIAVRLIFLFILIGTCITSLIAWAVMDLYWSLNVPLFIFSTLCLILFLPNILTVTFDEYQVVSIDNGSQFLVECVELDILSNKFIWSLRRRFETEAEAKKYVDEVFDGETLPSREIIYKRP